MGRPHRAPPQEGTRCAVNEVTYEAIAERVERRRRDPDFQAVLKHNIRRHQELLEMLADS